MRLIADRFVAGESASSTLAQDLATGQSVWLDVRANHDASEQQRWMLRCDELFQLRHPSLAPLVDYGLLGRSHRFEAWHCGGLVERSRTRAAAAAAQASRFLQNLQLTGGIAADRVYAGARSAVVIPPADAGFPRTVRQQPSTTDDEVPGVRLITRPSIAALAEMLRSMDARSRTAAIWGPPGAGLATAVLILAREARANGFVPIDAALLETFRGGLVAGRSLFVINRSAEGDTLRAFVRATIRTPRAHVCLVTARHEIGALDGVALERCAVETLIRAVRPWCERTRRAAREAAGRSDGLPGLFAHALWCKSQRSYQPARTRFSRVAERTAIYRAGPDGASHMNHEEPPPNEEARRWVATDDLITLRRKVEQADRLLAVGRHAPGLRLLRQAVMALARRGAWPDAARAGLALARELIARGRTRDALRALDTVTQHAAHSRDSALSSEAAILAGNAWIDAARLDEAERILRAGLAAVRHAGDRTGEVEIAIALARCLFWRADFDAAATLLDVDADPSSAEVCRRKWRMRARVSAGRGDSTRALAELAEARNLPVSGDALRIEADVLCTSAFVRLLVGDLEAVETDVRRCVTAGRAARRPMRVFSAFLLEAEASRRRHVAISPDRRRLLERLARAATPLLRLRWDLFVALDASRDDHATVARFSSGSSIKGLSLFARRSPWGSAEIDPLVREVVSILHVCHDAEDEAVVLHRICERLREQLHAAAVAFVAKNGARWEALVADGTRIESDCAERAFSAASPIGPHRVGARLEAAAPVQYGGRPIAVLCARWTPGAGDDLSSALSVLTMAATAAAPVVNGLILHRSRHADSARIELIGTTEAIGGVRLAVDRAAAAPFAVLIEGESGSGKELVARGIHRCGPRRDRAFCTLNCAALPDDLVEAELFGHARGSFTGAVADRPGVFEEAHGGTLFLDEVGELSMRAQAKLLRVIQEGELRRIGENVSRRIDVRVVSATNRDLRREAEAGRFRRDLLYRLDVIRITVPPLRERREDLAALVDHFWNDATRRVGSRAALSSAARAALGSYDWPGNVRELQNVLAALAVRCSKRGVVPPSALPPHIASVRRPDVWRLDAARRTFEEGFVRAALVRAGGHRSHAADELGLTRQGLNKLMSRLGIE